MRIRWLFVFMVTFGTVCTASAQVADIAGVLPGDRWVYEITDEISGDLKLTTTVFVLDVSEQEINTRVSMRGSSARQVVFDRNWNRIDDSVWKYRPSEGAGIKKPLQVGKEWRFESKAFNNQCRSLVCAECKSLGPQDLQTSDRRAVAGLEYRGAGRLFPKTVAPDDMEPAPFPGLEIGRPSSGDLSLHDTFAYPDE